MKFSSITAKTAAIAALALAAAGTASVAEARGNVFFSVAGNVAPGVSVGVSNAPVYYPPVTYVQPAPVYVQPAPVYAAPVYGPAYGYGYGVSYAAPVYYGPRGHWAHGHRHGWR